MTTLPEYIDPKKVKCAIITKIPLELSLSTSMPGYLQNDLQKFFFNRNVNISGTLRDEILKDLGVKDVKNYKNELSKLFDKELKSMLNKVYDKLGINRTYKYSKYSTEKLIKIKKQMEIEESKKKVNIT